MNLGEIQNCTCGAPPQLKDTQNESGEFTTYLVCPICGRMGREGSSDHQAVFNWTHNLLQKPGENAFILIQNLRKDLCELNKNVVELSRIVLDLAERVVELESRGMK